MKDLTYELPPKPPEALRLVFIGDIVGKPGMQIVCSMLEKLRAQGSDIIIANAENAADGTGLLVKQYEQLIAAGIDAITLGDHIYKKREIQEVLQRAGNIVKPANFPSKAPGKTYFIVEAASGVRVAVVSLMGRVFM